MDDFSEEARYTFAEAEFPDSGKSLQSRLPLSAQEKAIAELHETINQLAMKLNPVLSPANDTTEREGLGTEAPDMVSPLSSQLTANNRGIRRASKTIERLIERIEC